jgi:hypothetical protein
VDLTALPTEGNTIWNFPICTDVIFLAGFSETSMFPAKNSTCDDLADWCQESFGVTPRPRELADLWGVDDLVNRRASRILFTNGGHDMWSGGSIVESISDSLIARNFENGACHRRTRCPNYLGSSDKAAQPGFEESAQFTAEGYNLCIGRIFDVHIEACLLHFGPTRRLCRILIDYPSWRIAHGPRARCPSRNESILQQFLLQCRGVDEHTAASWLALPSSKTD